MFRPAVWRACVARSRARLGIATGARGSDEDSSGPDDPAAVKLLLVDDPEHVVLRLERLVLITDGFDVETASGAVRRSKS